MTGALAPSELGFPEHLQRLLPPHDVSHEESLQIQSSFTQHTKMPCVPDAVAGSGAARLHACTAAPLSSASSLVITIEFICVYLCFIENK